MNRIPPAFAALTTAREGQAGQRWIGRLPRLIDDLLADWRLQPLGGPMHGLVALVLPVRRDTGEECVLKISWPDEETRHEPTALRAWAGRAAVLLLTVDHTRNAMLLERLDAATTLRHQPITQALDVAASVLRQLHIPAPAGLTTTTQTAERWCLRASPGTVEMIGWDGAGSWSGGCEWVYPAPRLMGQVPYLALFVLAMRP